MSIGQIVYSSAGRDSGQPYVVLSIENDYVYLADGASRRIEKAKKKKLKHVLETEFINTSIKDKLENDIRVTNAELRKVISNYLLEDI